jgi:hypothetical protein
MKPFSQIFLIQECKAQKSVAVLQGNAKDLTYGLMDATIL